jgi:hypothetical protein
VPWLDSPAKLLILLLALPTLAAPARSAADSSAGFARSVCGLRVRRAPVGWRRAVSFQLDLPFLST